MNSQELSHTVLIVDDEDINLDLMQGILEDDYQVECYNNGADCLRRCQQSAVDLLLLDVDMPDLNGLEVCRRLLDIQPQCPVIFISAKGSNAERLEGYAAGGYDYIVKPCDPKELLAKIALILQQKEQYRQLDDTRAQIFDGFMEAASGSGEQGLLLQFSVSLFDVRSYQRLAELLLDCLQELAELKASVLVTGQQQPLACTSDGPCAPMEEEIMLLLKDKGRIYKFQQRYQINEARVSVLIKNMPVDEKISGRMLDHIPLLLRLASACVDNIDTSNELASSLQVIETVQSACTELDDAGEELRQSMLSFTTLTENEFLRISNEVQYLALTEQQENKLMTSFARALDQASKSSEQSLSVCNRLSDVINELRTLI